ncbi:DNA mismatch repair protein [Coemansia sp. RSA 1285]|nr:DNA mismatch repair protein [Coemansia sp. RSA 1285]
MSLDSSQHGHSELSPKPAPIRKLDESVINRIAAGEIINRPSNALKELIENSLDAGSTNISIGVKDGGLKVLQIQDNGHGIRTEDMHIVCERFTTSKLKTYEDLSTIQTYGFRGEALASISHVSHLSIITKQAESDCAYKASYSDGKIVPARPGGSSNPEPCAGNNGTVITAEDLFYNIPSRKSALKNTRDEYTRIFEVASRYAIHNSGVAFTCRKIGMPKADLNTQKGASTIANIRQIFGAKIASSLVQISNTDKYFDYEFKGSVSSSTHEMHKSIFLLFINHRLVDHTPIKRAVESLYTSILPKASRPFVYLDLRIKPQNIDVNTRLYMVDYCKISFHLFYHRCVFDFMNFGRILLQPAPSIYELALVAAQELGDENPEKLAEEVNMRFVNNSEMLEEFFLIRISDVGTVESMPMIVKEYSPDYDKLPLFLYNAAFSIDWENEQPFLKGFINALASLYALEPPLPDDPLNAKEAYRLMTEHRIFPSFKETSFWAPNMLLTENAVIQLADLPDLYRIFERC